MAISEDFEVEIHVNGEPLPEFVAPSLEDIPFISDANYPIVHRYVEAIVDTEFTIMVKILPHYIFSSDYISFWATLDGKTAQSEGLILNEDDTGKKAAMMGYRYEQEEQSFCMPFKFQPLLLTHDGVPGRDINVALRQLGRIKIEIHRVMTTKHEAELNSMNDSSLAVDEEPIHEKILKGRSIDISAGFGPSKNTAAFDVTHTTEMDEYPLVNFVFDYRTRKGLQFLDVIETTPEPIPLEERDPESLSREELLELVQKQKDAAEDASRIKKEKTQSSTLVVASRKRSATLLSEDDEEELRVIPAAKKMKPAKLIELSDSE